MEETVKRDKNRVYLKSTFEILTNIEEDGKDTNYPEILERPKYRQIIVTLRRNIMWDTLTLPDLSEKVDINYSTVIDTVPKLEDEGLVMTKKEGRSKKIKLTDKGTQIATKLMEIEELMEAN
jgi:predicted transcriptional regulator